MSNKQELAVFCHKMYSAIHAGFDVERAFVVMQDEHSVLDQAIKRTHQGITKGLAVSEAMRVDEHIYTSELVDCVFVCEQTGHVETAFERMARHFDAQLDTIRKIKRAATYPAIVVIVFIGALLAVAKVYDFLPLAMIICCAIVGFIAALVIVPRGVKSMSRSSAFVGNVLIKLPIIGQMVQKSELADFASNMAIFYSCGAEVSKGLEYSARSLRNEALRVKVKNAARIVELGNPLSDGLAAQAIFPPDMINAIRTGEASGNVEGMLDKIEKYYRAEVQGKSDIIFAVFRS
ncbi:MAG: type II secretion system F family protein [Lachnospiraceae bacterium]|nr:type II secretion system F family protein [Lachnospiraceae bacterium]